MTISKNKPKLFSWINSRSSHVSFKSRINFLQ